MKGWRDLCTTFGNNGLSVPPVPEGHRKELAHLNDWCWSTRDDIESGTMYQFRYADELLLGAVPDYTAISHAGHGTNSYGLNVSIVYGPVALLFQHSLGGAYSNPTEQSFTIAAAFSYMRTLIESVTAFGSDGRSLRHVIAWSGFRGIVDYYTRYDDKWVKRTDEGWIPKVRLDGDNRLSIDREAEPIGAACERFLNCLTVDGNTSRK